jgi:hypothetical protein
MVWDQLRHDHILSFYGIVTDLGQIHMVSPWQEHGNVLEYVLVFKMEFVTCSCRCTDMSRGIQKLIVYIWYGSMVAC